MLTNVLLKQYNGKNASELIKKLPISSVYFRDKVMSALSSRNTKKAIKPKFKGSMCVLCSSNDLYMMHDGKSPSYYHKHPERFIEDVNKAAKTVVDISDVQIDHIYDIKDQNGNYAEFYDKKGNKISGKALRITTPTMYYLVKDFLAVTEAANKDIAEDANKKHYNLYENIESPRNLASYYCKFKSKDGTRTF